MRVRGQAFEPLMLVLTVVIAVTVLALITNFYAQIPSLGTGAKPASQKLVRLVWERGFGAQSVAEVEWPSGERIFKPELTGETGVREEDLAFVCLDEGLCGPGNPLDAPGGKWFEAHRKVTSALAACTDGKRYRLAAAAREEQALVHCRLELEEPPAPGGPGGVTPATPPPATPTPAPARANLTVLVQKLGDAPARASVMVDGRVVRTGLAVPDSHQENLQAGRTYTVRAEAEGCLPDERPVFVEAPGATRTLTLECRQGTAFIQLSVTGTAPNDTGVVFRAPGVEKRKSGIASEPVALPVGDYEVEAVGTGCTGEKASVRIEPDRQSLAYVRLTCPGAATRNQWSFRVEVRNWRDSPPARTTLAWTLDVDGQRAASGAQSVGRYNTADANETLSLLEFVEHPHAAGSRHRFRVSIEGCSGAFAYIDPVYCAGRPLSQCRGNSLEGDFAIADSFTPGQPSHTLVSLTAECR
jgi:hypothetical protein